MNAIGALSDKGGNDEYHPTSHSYLGTASCSNPRGEYFRRSMPTIGLFVDLGGDDRDPASGRLKNKAHWFHQSGSPVWGFG